MNCRKIWWNCKFSMGSWATARSFLQFLWSWCCVNGGLGDDSTLAGVMGCVLKTTLRYAMHIVMEVASCLCQGSGVMSLPTVCGTNSKGVLFSIEKIADGKLMLKHEEWKQAALVVRMKFQEARKKNYGPNTKNKSPYWLRVQRIHKVLTDGQCSLECKLEWELRMTNQPLQLRISSFADVAFVLPNGIANITGIWTKFGLWELSCRVMVCCGRWT